MGYILALAVGLGSLTLYGAAFFFPEVHRKYDFLWSGIGLVYGVALWANAGQASGSLLLGEGASIALLGWLGWQTLKMRRSLTPIDEQTHLPESVTSVVEGIEEVVGQLRTSLQDPSWQASLPDSWRKRFKQAIQLPEEIKSWIVAFFSTTFQATTAQATTAPETSDRENRVSIVTLGQTTAKSIATGLSRAAAWFSRLSDQLQERAEHGLEPQHKSSWAGPAMAAEGRKQTELAQIQSEESPGPGEEAAVDFEWDDSEPESYPDLDTVDSATPPSRPRAASHGSNLASPESAHPAAQAERPTASADPATPDAQV